jgi:hypothetical protein
VSRPGEHLECAFPVFSEGHSFPGKDVGRSALSNSSSSVVLGGVDVARAPSDLGTERGHGLNKSSSLNGHVKGSRDSSSSHWGLSFVFLTESHETGHFNFSDVQFFSSKFVEADVSAPVTSVVLK